MPSDDMGILTSEKTSKILTILEDHPGLVTPISKPFRPFGRGTTLLRGLSNDDYEPGILTGMIIRSDEAFCQILGPFHGPLSHLAKLMSKGTSQETLKYHEYDNLLH